MGDSIATALDTDDFTAILARITPRLIPDPPGPTPEEQAAAHAAAWEHRATLLGIPKRLHAASLTTSTPTPAITRVGLFVTTEAPHGRCLVLCGPTGVGKSYAAAAALRRWHPPGSTFFYWPELCASLLHPYSHATALAAAFAPGLVVFDDLGAEYLKEGGILGAHIDSIIWRRHANILPTIITTNLTPEQLQQRFSDRIIDRLRHEWASIHTITHDSLRRAPAPPNASTGSL